MAKKKRKRRAARAGATPEGSALTPSAASIARRERKEAARLQRERDAKAQVRRGALRRGLIGGLVGLIVFFAISWFTNRAPAARPYPQAAIDAGVAASCSELQTPSANPERGHLDPGEAHTYTDHPATSGIHDPTPLGSHGVFPSPVTETQAVHSLEHGSVIMYYRASSDTAGLNDATVQALGPIATSSPATYLIPYPDLPSSTALAYTAWNKLVTCPANIKPDQAVTIAHGFIDSFACTNNAPEGKNGDGC
ncbi:MAG: DUF3105 domain-containing protein [Actinomycetota bacterium]